MILVDTSVWIDHLRKADDTLISLLNSTQVVIHPFIIGELACGNLKNRAELLALLGKLPAVQSAQQEEVLYFIEHNQLMGRGIGFIDVHLLASLALSNHTLLWTRDKRLGLVAEQLGMAFNQP
ncbi:MAG: type II toxin-antitoxin system VapC family toxin [Candidatus Electrothrix sp. LOE2]|jgi:predicted nucleic acid-binding protein|nr:type II toxin-antitoxin system VapC family toxin [Candidatus Electrothrix sp. LOE2]